MKKIIFTMIAAMLAFTACEQPFEPAADPQAYPQEDARTLPDAFTVSPVSDIDLAKVTGDVVSVATLGSSNLPEDASFGPFTVVIEDAIELAADGQLKVSKAALQQAVADLYGLKPVPRKMSAMVKSSVQIEGQGFKFLSNKFDLTVAPEAPVLDEHYYYIGAANSWSSEDMTYELKNASGKDFYDDPVISVTIPAPVDADGNRVDNWFKIAPGVAYESENFWDNIFIGAVENGESAYEGKFLMAHNDAVGAFNIGPASEDATYYTIQLNLLEQTYSVKALNFPAHLYMIGAEFGAWDWNSDGVVELTPVLHNPDWGAEAEGQFWTVRYFTAGQGFKFCSKREWNGDFWGLSINDGFTEDGGNCVVAEDGFYLVHIDMKRSMVHVEPARIYGIGDCFGGWNAEMEDALFKAEGKTLRATVANSGEIRMYAASSIATSDWWTREFVFFDGKIAYRGNAGDQERVKVLKDQTVVLDFNAGTATVYGEGEAPTLPENMYMIGEAVGGWDWNTNAVDMIPVNGKLGQFWAIRYLEAGKGFKFNSKKEWGGDFWGLDTNTGFDEDGGNCIVAEDGLYMIYVDVENSKVCVEPAKVYGIGDCFGSWDVDNESALFEVDGKTMKATMPNSGELRMYAASSIATSDWWTREFIFFDGKIAFRGNGGDQDRVKVLKDQTVVLDFDAGTAEVQGEGEAPTLPENLFMIGEAVGGWDWGTNAVDMIPVNGKAGQFWAIRYLEADKGFKFNSKKDWGGDFWGLETNEGYDNKDGNAFVKETGVYMICVDVANGKVCVEPAKVFGIGECFGGWDSDPVAFTVEEDKVVGTTTAEGKIRLFANSSISDSDWWTREFVFFEGKIAYRGNGGDQDPVTVEAGKKVILDFNAGTATVE